MTTVYATRTEGLYIRSVQYTRDYIEGGGFIKGVLGSTNVTIQITDSTDHEYNCLDIFPFFWKQMLILSYEMEWDGPFRYITLYGVLV